MSDRSGIFAGDDPYRLARDWLAEAEKAEINDPNAIALATVDADGLPNVRMVLLKEIETSGEGGGAFVFYTNFDSAKGQEIAATGKAAFVLHWKSLRRQVRVRGIVSREEGPQADAYYRSRALQSRLGAWASQQSRPLASRAALLADVARVSASHGLNPARPPFWGGFRIRPLEVEFWADGAFRLHDRFRWSRQSLSDDWKITRLSP
ncbi:MAG: pyridoxamine 5'-phosphate oxidase [Limimaricola sp.]|uniref:pyridoxamine 5'-phosphate oxidase n=1 Tax=Limimaricola sp. TaxID=2211665 RepID=UPI001D7D5649|nr:pyridoxamine 5'-phosphate oxidase [Limimaricola sp.]MBI1416727.1 pyridoxamine 5'-phosphate oxidase [Limimaricola sp.]